MHLIPVTMLRKCHPMRPALAGIILLLCPAAVFAQASGFVESVGFGETTTIYRSTCWTPMLVYLTSEIDQPMDYLIEVHQEDLDGDKVIYSVKKTLSGNRAGSTPQAQMFWTYFIPRPTGRGLPQERADQQAALRVYLCNASNGKQIKLLPIKNLYKDLDPYTSPFARGRASRLVLVLSDRNNKSINIDEYSQAFGLMEDAHFLLIHPDRLPENPIAYEAVDAILWMDCDPSQPAMADKLPAVRDWVRKGGKLVICQRELWEPTEKAFGGDMLPVTFPRIGPDKDHLQQGMFNRKTLDPLGKIAFRGEDWRPQAEAWQRQGTYRMARAMAIPGTLVEETLVWDDNLMPDRTPYLARRPYGLGVVTWVAQDLSDPILRGGPQWRLAGWAKIWDRIFDWNNNTSVPRSQKETEDYRKDWEQQSGVDLGGSFVRQMEHQGKVGFLIFLAVLFFVGYLVLAGPVSYFVLKQRKQAHLSWFVFGASALVATALTMGVVGLVLRGKPQVKHMTLVRQSPGNITTIESRIGLYIPKDGPQEVRLDMPAESASRLGVSYITPFPIHPSHLPSDNEAGGLYTIPVRETVSDKALAVEFPYRRSLKKMKVNWVGQSKSVIEGTATLREKEAGGAWVTEGTLKNTTGQDLESVYVAYTRTGKSDDLMYYRPAWKSGESLNLAELDAAPPLTELRKTSGWVKGRIGTLDDREWPRVFINDRLRGWQYETDDSSDSQGRSPTAFPMLSLFDRMPAMKMPAENVVNISRQRVELLRRGARHWDMSNALAAGGLVILATVPNGPVPMPVKVEGDVVGGSGPIFYQVVLPLGRLAAKPVPPPPAPATTQAGGL